MPSDWLYYLWAVLLIAACAVCWFGTLLTLPGNWGIVVLAAGFAWLEPRARGLGWGTVAALVALAIAGEIIEALAGAAGAARRGGSRRGMALSLVGAAAGSMVGVALGLPIPIPVVSSAIAAVVGGAMGAFAGAMLGEHWKGRPVGHQLQIGRAAPFGRLWGTVGKLVVGIVMLVLVAADVLF